ncbi:hypothetical protein BV898_19972, partial [Hypsibius exemplaris]
VGKSGCLDVWMSGCLDVGMSGCRDVGMSGCLDVGMFRNFALKIDSSQWKGRVGK